MNYGEQRSAIERLPWTAPDGKACYVVRDSPDVPDGPQGPVTRRTTVYAEAQLSMAEQLVGHAEALLSAGTSDRDELRYVGRRLVECLTDVVRLAREDTRVARLTAGSGQTSAQGHSED
ncbi:hypothetical protein [Streptomyces sp. NPDC051684]|uniref:hypothetical protein n=1 Tax=Streptomyces sp. NPDC051684 TaxID=3365670 RepID=UPI0037A4976B